MKRVSLYTLGCRLNQAESDSLASGLIAGGYRVVAEGEEAELCVINTCSVTEQADAKCRHLVRSILRKMPDAYVVVTGCYAQSGAETLRAIPGVDLIVGTEKKMEIPGLVASAVEPLEKNGRPRVIHTTKISRRNFILDTYAAYDRATRPNIKIQDGCDFFCAFCIIPYTRGRERSRDFDDVLREARAWAQRGRREVVLTGVNLGAYRDRGRDLADLIDAIEPIDGIERIRISSIEPTTVSDRLLDRMAVSKKLCPYLHIPVQSGSDAVLSAMGRKYTAAEYERLILTAIEKIPGLGLGTDVMVGFPGEEEADFRATVRLLERLPFSYFHLFPYSRRKGTKAARLGNGVRSKPVKARGKELQSLSASKRRSFYERHLGRIVSVLFEKNEGEDWTGLTPDYLRVVAATDEDVSGEIRPVRIVSIEEGRARGVLAG
jgi:threonylcarbamoyladenosine tRNA methylthiotransferase MtaB